MTEVERREELIEAVERDEAELEQALQDLKEAAARPFEWAADVRRRLVEQPLPWLLSAALLGLWLGARSNRTDHQD